MYDNQVRNGNYTLHIITEKQLSAADLRTLLAHYMQQRRLTQLPATGEDFFTVPVLDSSDYLQ